MIRSNNLDTSTHPPFIKEASLNLANLTLANLEFTNLQYAVLEGATLTMANFNHTELYRI